MAQDFPNMFWTFEEEQGWGAEFDIEGGDFINVKTYDAPTWKGEEEVDCGGRYPITLTKLSEEHPNFGQGIGWYIDWSMDFAGKTLEEAKKYVLKNCYS